MSSQGEKGRETIGRMPLRRTGKVLLSAGATELGRITGTAKTDRGLLSNAGSSRIETNDTNPDVTTTNTGLLNSKSPVDE
jgi:hypothetical protein